MIKPTGRTKHASKKNGATSQNINEKVTAGFSIVGAMGNGDQEVVINRDWDDTWHAGIAFSHIDEEAGRAFSFGFAYESSPVSDSNRTIDFAMDEQFKFSGAYAWEVNDDWKCSFGLTASFMGDASVKQETQGETFEGDFSTNIIVFSGFTAQRRF